jgi:hypothetical protein
LYYFPINEVDVVTPEGLLLLSVTFESVSHPSKNLSTADIERWEMEMLNSHPQASHFCWVIVLTSILRERLRSSEFKRLILSSSYIYNKDEISAPLAFSVVGKCRLTGK